MPRASKTQSRPVAVNWLRGFGGVKVAGLSGALWPARICSDDTEGGEKVQKLRKPDRILVHSYGDNQYVWARPSSLSQFKVADAEAALNTPRNWHSAPLLKAALVDAIIAIKGTAAPPTPAATSTSKWKKTSMSPTTPRKEAPVAHTVESVRADRPAVAHHLEPDEGDEEEEIGTTDASSAEGLSAYEMERLANIARNQKVLEALGVVGASASLRNAAASPKRTPIDPAIAALRAQQRAQQLAEAYANKRKSSRLAENPDRPAPVRYSDEYAALEEAEHAMRIPLKRKRGSSAPGSGRGRGGRSSDVESALSEAERAALAEAYAEAEGWLNDMRRYFTDKLSEGKRPHSTACSALRLPRPPWARPSTLPPVCITDRRCRYCS